MVTQCLVFYPVPAVGDVAVRRAQLTHQGDIFIDIQVGAMFGVAEPVHGEGIQSHQQGAGGFGQGFDVRHVAEGLAAAAEDVAIRFDGGMDDRNGCHVDVSHGKRLTGVVVRIGAYVALVCVVLIKGPAVHAAQVVQAICAGVERQAVLAVPAEGAHVVEAGNVIQVLVCVDDGIDGCQMVSQGLLSQIRAGVDEQRRAGGGDEDGRAKAFVTRVG